MKLNKYRLKEIGSMIVGLAFAAFVGFTIYIVLVDRFESCPIWAHCVVVINK
jgi:hypothetical protein